MSEVRWIDVQKERQKEKKHDSFSVGHEDGSPVEIEGEGD